jgi:hypothetical protein
MKQKILHLFLYLSVFFLMTCSDENTITPPVDLTSGLAAYYPFNGNASDESGHGNDGVINGALFTEDRFGKAFSAIKFTGNGFISFGNKIDLHDSAMTINLWLKSGDFKQSAKIINKGQSIFGSPVNSGYSLRIVQPPAYVTFSGEAELWFHVIDNSAHQEKASYPVSKLPVDQYFMLTAVFTKTNPGANLKMYINANLIANQDIEFSKSETNLPLTIGALDRGPYGYVDDYFKGFIDDVKIYRRKLNSIEIEALLNE